MAFSFTNDLIGDAILDQGLDGSGGIGMVRVPGATSMFAGNFFVTQRQLVSCP